MSGTNEHRVHLPYGEQTLTGRIQDAELLGELDMKSAPAVPDPDRAVRDALRHPIGLSGPLLRDFRPADRLVIVVSDSFRQTRADLMLPPLLDELHKTGLNDDNILVLFSTGTHRPPAEAEQRAILGPAVFDRFRDRIQCHEPHNPDAHVRLGTTTRGTPVEINRTLHEADRVIVTGAVTLHYFGGFGGGRKSIVPGLASAKTIAHNHAMNLHPTEDTLDPAVRIGVMDGNPVAEDMLEAARFTRVDGMLHTVLNRDGEVAAVFAGELDAAHRAACSLARDLYVVPVRQPADLVIAASAHTRNFVQTHKALYNAYQAVRPSGRIVLAAPCPEGLGGEQFTQWLDLGDRQRIITALRENSEINGQTALSTLEKAPITLFVTGLTDDEVHRLGGLRCTNLQQAIDLALAELRDTGHTAPTVYLMPHAAYTVPRPAAAPQSELTP